MGKLNARTSHRRFTLLVLRNIFTQKLKWMSIIHSHNKHTHNQCSSNIHSRSCIWGFDWVRHI